MNTTYILGAASIQDIISLKRHITPTICSLITPSTTLSVYRRFPLCRLFATLTGTPRPSSLTQTMEIGKFIIRHIRGHPQHTYACPERKHHLPILNACPHYNHLSEKPGRTAQHRPRLSRMASRQSLIAAQFGPVLRTHRMMCTSLPESLNKTRNIIPISMKSQTSSAIAMPWEDTAFPKLKPKHQDLGMLLRQPSLPNQPCILIYHSVMRSLIHCGWKDCTYSGGFSREACLWRHIKSTHISPKALTCPHCNKTFGLGREDKLRAHKRLAHRCV